MSYMTNFSENLTFVTTSFGFYKKKCCLPLGFIVPVFIPSSVGVALKGLEQYNVVTAAVNPGADETYDDDAKDPDLEPDLDEEERKSAKKAGGGRRRSVQFNEEVEVKTVDASQPVCLEISEDKIDKGYSRSISACSHLTRKHA